MRCAIRHGLGIAWSAAFTALSVRTSAAASSVLEPAGAGARLASKLWWWIGGTLSVLYVLIGALLVFVIVRRATRVADGFSIPPPDEPRERRLAKIVAVNAVLTTLLLVVFLAVSLSVGHAVVALSSNVDVRMKVTGHQWWWEIEYEDPVASNTFVTANEFHVPVGKTVDLHLVSADVIHSFWIPNLTGKRDLIPGRNNHVVIRAERAGEYVGQCAEFCGLQHAHMRIVVVAESDEDFARWLVHEREPAPEPTGEKEIHGRQVFTSGPCVMCHTVRGTMAASRAGPELTHLASRRTLGAGTIPNTRAHLFAWITDSQSVKPGNRMPQVPMQGADLDDLAAWLETLR
ncbi:MAG TPA: cytochrome c oxidase subunit II [Candidatus Limnocylindrales bacterium]|nr:cytochrome c oxidase subunit II [Candidatus Limnocylindrales bacterium]